MNTKNVISNLMCNGTKVVVPEVGMKCVKLFYTDRQVCTITEIKGNSIKVRDNKVKILDYWACKYEILDDLKNGEQVFTKRKNGVYVLKGESMKNGLCLSLNNNNHYIDPTF